MLTSTSFATFCVEKGKSRESVVEARFDNDEQIVCSGRTWPDSQTSRPRAEMRMPCALRTGKYGKNVWTGKSRERERVARRQQKMGET